jgi:hypothetical protein
VVRAAWRERFARIYDLQAGGAAFERPEELLGAAGLAELAQVRGGGAGGWWAGPVGAGGGCGSSRC